MNESRILSDSLHFLGAILEDHLLSLSTGQSRQLKIHSMVVYGIGFPRSQPWPCTTQRGNSCGWQDCGSCANKISEAEEQCLFVCNMETGSCFGLCLETEKSQVTYWQHS